MANTGFIIKWTLHYRSKMYDSTIFSLWPCENIYLETCSCNKRYKPICRERRLFSADEFPNADNAVKLAIMHSFSDIPPATLTGISGMNRSCLLPALSAKGKGILCILPDDTPAREMKDVNAKLEAAK